MRRLPILLLCLAFVPVLGQDALNESVQVEIAGNGVFISINYERKFTRGFSARAGVGPAPFALFIPISFGKTFFHGNHHPEISMGLTYGVYDAGRFAETVNRSQLFTSTFFGYRYDNPERRFIFRLGYTPFIRLTELAGENRYYPYFGCGLGFKW
jgi:hypothetical protein